MRTYVSILLVLLGAVVNTIPRWPSIFYFNGDEFCLWQAGSFVILGIAALIKENTKPENTAWTALVVVAFGNYYDEKWGRAINPNQLQLIGEVALAIGIVSWAVFSILKWIKQKQQ